MSTSEDSSAWRARASSRSTSSRSASRTCAATGAGAEPDSWATSRARVTFWKANSPNQMATYGCPYRRHATIAMQPATAADAQLAAAALGLRLTPSITACIT